jgi:Zn ribbon nucleic-acid-binding protein
MAKCPRCFSRIELHALWKLVPRGHWNLLGSGHGVACAACGSRSRIVVWRANSLALAFYVICAYGMFLSIDYLPQRVQDSDAALFAVIASILLVPGYLVYRLVPLGAVLQLAGDKERLNFPLDWDTTELLPVELPEVVQPVSRGKPWKCGKCREDNPGEFDICWSCQTERAGV